MNDETGKAPAMLAQAIKEQTGAQPTLRGLLRVLSAAGMDRGSLVREKTEVWEPGVVVVMIGPKALRDLSPIVLEHARALDRECGTGIPQEPLGLTPDANLRTALEWVDKQPPHWAWATAAIDAADVLIYMATGESVTEDLAARLSQAGCLTRLK